MLSSKICNICRIGVIEDSACDFEDFVKILHSDYNSESYDEYDEVVTTSRGVILTISKWRDSAEFDQVSLITKDSNLQISLAKAVRLSQSGVAVKVFVKPNEKSGLFEHNLRRLSRKMGFSVVPMSNFRANILAKNCHYINSTKAVKKVSPISQIADIVKASKVLFTQKTRAKIAAAADWMFYGNTCLGFISSLFSYLSCITVSIWLGSYFSDIIVSAGEFFEESLFPLQSYSMFLWSLKASLSALFFVLSYVPKLAILFFMIDVITVTKIMNRINLSLGVLLNKIGLSSNSVEPIVAGYTCSITAYSLADNIEDKNERFVTMSVVNFLICSGKSLTIIFLVSLFFSGTDCLLVAGGIYLLSFVVAICSVGFFNFLMGIKPTKTNRDHLISLLPDYEALNLAKSLLRVRKRLINFLGKSKSLFITAWIVWLVVNVPILQIISSGDILHQFFVHKVHAASLAEASQSSALFKVSNSVNFLFAPLGFDWRLTAAFFVSFAAKEYSVSVIKILYYAVPAVAINDLMATESAISFIVLSSVWLPCLPAVMMFFKNNIELKKFIYFFFYSFAVAYALALAAKHLAVLL